MRKIKKPKYVWHFDKDLWGYTPVKYEVVEVLQPTKFDAFLLCKVRNGSYSEETDLMWMRTFDLHNDEVFPDTPKVRKLMRRYKEHKEEMDKNRVEVKQEWLPFLDKIGVRED